MRMRTAALSALSALLIGASMLALPFPAAAQSSALSVSITPPLFNLTIGPGETWSSSVKVVNTNARPVTYYAYTSDFRAQGETGHVSFVPQVDEGSSTERETFSLASWITLGSGPVTVAPGASADIPFTVRVPKNAEPGGHYAAILIGTQPRAVNQNGTEVNISSYVSSLLFVRVRGDVVERGRILEFSTSKELYQSPQADFTLRFENMGNTHVLPEGSIAIYNMWGKERGNVDINQDNGGFGNVLPGTVRRFQFSWHGDNPFDVGLYRAIVTLAYGQESRKNVSATTYFWVVPVIPVACGLAGLILFIWLIAWLIRRYIRHALSLERERLSDAAHPAGDMPSEVPHTLDVFMEPLREGVVDLRNLTAGRAAPVRDIKDGELPASAPVRDRMTVNKFLRKYRLFLLSLVVFIAVGAIAYHYLSGVLSGAQHFQITDVKIGQESATSTAK